MSRRVCYRVSEFQGDPSLAPACAAGFLGAAALIALATLAYLPTAGPLAQMLAAALAVCIGFLGVSFLGMLRRTVQYAHADEESGLLFRLGNGRRISVPWPEVLRVVRHRRGSASAPATLHVLCRPRRRLVLPPGPGQDEIYNLALAILDRKAKPGPRPGKQRAAEPAAPPAGAMVASGHNPYRPLWWALLKLVCVIAGGLFIVLARDRATPLEQAFFIAIAFELAVPIGLFPPSALGAVIRAAAGPKGLSYQTILYGTRTIPWDRLVHARFTILGGVGPLMVRLLEFYDLEGARLLMPAPRAQAFLKYVDRALGTDLVAMAEATARPARAATSGKGRRRRR